MAKHVSVLSFTSGKGGVGKTNLIVNVGIELCRRGNRVLLIDTDMGLANVDILLGLAPKYNIKHLFSGEKSVEEIVVDGPNGLKILPASSGVQELTHLSQEESYGFLSAVEDLGMFDYILLDTGAGISDNVLYFNAAAQDIFVVITPEPTSLTDGYAMIKVLHQKHRIKRFKVVVNQVSSRKEAEDVFMRINKVAGHFLNIGLDYAGFVYHDKLMSQAVVKQKPFTVLFPNSSVSACVKKLADKMERSGFLAKPTGNIQIFWQRLVGND